MYLLYDGSCRFCTAGSARLVRLARAGVIRKVSNKDEAQMAALPEKARAGISSALQLVSPDGEVASGAEAVNRALATRPLWRLITWIYWVPGIKQINDWVYGIVARM
jgi:predicted DCC family thiol-disulfide oxidoreductase YuxK